MNLLRKYPRFFIAIFSFVVAFIMVADTNIIPFHDAILKASYFGSFAAGFLYVFTFTAAPATALLILLHDTQNIYFLGVIAGVGALLGDLLIYKTARAGFHKETERLLEEAPVKVMRKFIPAPIRRIFAVTFAFIIIASPLPDEFGVAMISNFGLINSKYFVFLSFVLNTIGIFTILLITEAIVN